MGVVRDVTVDNLVTAVGNIDTSTLAQDSTLQDVATAIGNISGGNDPVTNTTVNSLCKDTTGQSIASAISGLGTTLGANKADIDGGNIVNPSAFRSAIGIEPTSTTTGTNGGTVRRWGNIVSINFQGTTGTNIGSVPSGYRPQTTAERTIVYVEKYNGSTLTNRYYALLAVESNGNISCSYASSYGGTSFPSAKDANHKLYGNITYVIADND